MTPSHIRWEALRLRIIQKRIEMTSGKGHRAYKSKDITQDLQFRKTTGRCPVCKSRPANRETCGSDECVSIWTIGHVPSYYRKWAWKE